MLSKAGGEQALSRYRDASELIAKSNDDDDVDDDDDDDDDDHDDDHDDDNDGKRDLFSPGSE